MSQQSAVSKTLIVSTCGTSVLTHNSESDVRKRLSTTTNCRESEVDQETQEFIDARVSEQKKLLTGTSELKTARRISAELNGIIGFYEGDIRRGVNDEHILIHTDTFQGEKVAEILTDWLKSKNINARCHKVEDLNTSDLESFHAGMNGLIKWCEETLTGYRDLKYRIVFNLTGGFKSLQGFMQTLGMFYADEMIYIFETGDSLLRIPRLPIQIESAALDQMREHLMVFRKLDDTNKSLSASEGDNILETFLFRIDDEITLSPWGRIIWERNKKKLYREDVLDPISDKVRYSPSVRQSVKDLPADQLLQFNQRMDDLSRFMDSGQKLNINRLDFKKLKGNPKPPSTHECDLWANQGAWRAFGHFDDSNIFVVDSIGPGLH